jgi:hypothetical protein
LFVIWQICFLVGINGRVLARGDPNHLVQRIFSRWEQLSAQWQSWGFFAAFTPPQCSFAEVDLRWPSKTETIRSVFEPKDTARYFQPVLEAHRRFNFEAKLTVSQARWDEWLVTAAPPEGWHKYMSGVLHIHGGAMCSYLRWHLRNYLREHPDAPVPQEVVLKLRLYEHRAPDDEAGTYPGPVERPLLIWRPGSEPSPDYWPIEVFDPRSGQPERYLYAETEKTEP